jgi:hypothetical protein
VELAGLPLTVVAGAQIEAIIVASPSAAFTEEGDF